MKAPTMLQKFLLRVGVTRFFVSRFLLRVDSRFSEIECRSHLNLAADLKVKVLAKYLTAVLRQQHRMTLAAISQMTRQIFCEHIDTVDPFSTVRCINSFRADYDSHPSSPRARKNK